MKDGKRKREGKDTVFIYGYQECSLERAEKTVKRSKSNRNMPLQEGRLLLLYCLYISDIKQMPLLHLE